MCGVFEGQLGSQCGWSWSELVEPGGKWVKRGQGNDREGPCKDLCFNSWWHGELWEGLEAGGSGLNIGNALAAQGEETVGRSGEGWG